MFDILTHLFGAVCGQNPEHLWRPGGVLLPCCQRCTGMYGGALVAIGLHVWLRPRPSTRFLKVHGLFLLLILPCASPWLPQGPVLRTMSGILFGFGVVAFLMLSREEWLVRRPGPGLRPGLALYFFGLAGTLLLLPFVAAFGGPFAAYVLSILACSGALGLAVLVLVNLSRFFLAALRT